MWEVKQGAGGHGLSVSKDVPLEAFLPLRVCWTKSTENSVSTRTLTDTCLAQLRAYCKGKDLWQEKVGRGQKRRKSGESSGEDEESLGEGDEEDESEEASVRGESDTEGVSSSECSEGEGTDEATCAQSVGKDSNAAIHVQGAGGNSSAAVCVQGVRQQPKRNSRRSASY